MREHDDFYVGYLPTPPRLRRFVWGCVIGILMAAACVAAIGASRQRDPGPGTWNLDQSDAVVGTFIAKPYPTVQTSTSSLLLVGDGKRAAAVDANLDGRAVRVRGHRIQRRDLELIELEAIEPADTGAVETARFSTPTPVTLRGEMVDPKCFAGAMKPGDGKPHKACATLCIRGGIPPAFITRNADGQVVTYLLVDTEGRALTGNALERIIPYVADPVVVGGVSRERGGQKFLTIDPDRVKRL